METALQHDHPQSVRPPRLARLAVSCAGRLFRDVDGRVWLVRGRPEPVALFNGLRTQSRADATLPHPRQLGFAASQLERLSPAFLAEWRRELATARKARQRMKATGRARARQQATLAAVETQLDWIESQCAPGMPAGYPLSFAAEETLQRAPLEELDDLYLPPHWQGMARFLVWLDGTARLRPWLLSIQPHLLRRTQFEEVAALANFRTLVESWSRAAQRHPQRMAAALPELVLSAVCLLPPRLADCGLMEVPGPRRRPATVCREFFDRIQGFLKGRAQRLSPNLPAFLTTLYACRLTDGPVWGSWIQSLLELRRPTLSLMRSYLVSLVDESRRPAYVQMLATLNTSAGCITPSELGNVRRAHEHGATPEEFKWLAKFGMCGQFTAATRPTRRIEQLLSRHGLELWRDRARAFNGRVGCDLTLAAAQWLARLPATLTPAARSAVNELLGLLTGKEPLLAQCRAAFLDLLAEPASQEPADQQDLGLWLRRLRYLRSQAGGSPSLPGRIQRMLDREERERKELAWLQAHAGGPDWSGARAARLALLKSRDHSPEAQRGRRAADQRLLEWAREGFAVAAAEGAVRIVAAKVDAWWRAVVGPPRPELTTRDRTTLCTWAQNLRPRARKDLLDIMDAWNTHGNDYRRHLPGNAAWLAKARQDGIDLDAWFAPRSEPVVVNRQFLRIERASDPIEVLLMGTWFDTCLDLNTGENCMSALANAYEADKAVLYVRADGRRIARKLVALTAGNQLLGFDTYYTDYDWGDAHRSSDDKRDDVDAVLERYALNWIERAGLAGLGLAERPAIVGQRFWYDDTSVGWPTLNREAAQPAAAAPALALPAVHAEPAVV